MVTKKEGKKKGRKSNMKKDPKIALFGHIFQKSMHIHFWVHGHFSSSTFNLHLVRGPKNLEIHV